MGYELLKSLISLGCHFEQNPVVAFCINKIFPLAEMSIGPFSEKWNQSAIFKNANKLHKSSWKRIEIDRIL